MKIKILCLLIMFATQVFSQNVGVGTTTPLSKLHVAGAIRSDTLIYIGPGVRSLFAAPNGRIYDSLVTPSTVNWEINGNANIGASNFLGTTNANDLIFKTNNTEQARILTNGNMGIGTSAPTAKLHVLNGIIKIDGTNNVNTNSAYMTFGLNNGTNLGYVGDGSSGDNNSYLWSYNNSVWIGTGTLASSARSIFLDQTGNTGIGTITPGNKLEITSAAANSSGLRFSNLTSASTTVAANGKALSVDVNGDVILIPSASNAWQLLGNAGTVAGTNFLGTTDAQDLVIKTTAIERLRVAANGNIGVNTPAPSVLFTNSAFHAGDQSGLGTQVTMGMDWNANARGYAASFYNSGSVTGSSGALIKITDNTANSKVLTLNVGPVGTGIDIVNVFGNGNMGINSSSPGTKLEVGASGGDGITIKSNTGTDAGDLIFLDISGGEKGRVYTNSAAASGLILSGGSVPASHVFIDNNGNTGISMTAPITKLHVAAMHPGAATGNGAASDAPSEAIITAGSDGTTRLNDWPVGWLGGLSTWDIVGSNSFFSAFTVRSDRKLKRDITDMNAVQASKILQLRPVTYYLKEQAPGTEGLQYGFIAQEVRELFPSIVTKSIDESSIIGMNYQALIAPAIYVIQQQQKEIEILKAKNTLASKDLSILKKQQEEMQLALKKIQEELLNLQKKKN